MERIVKWKSRLSAVILIPIATIALTRPSLFTFFDHQSSLGGLAASPATWRHWIAVGPLSLFFYLAGAELRWEFREGLFRDRRKALIVLGSVIGGMAAPALIYLFIARLTGATSAAWGVPMATDLPLVLAALSFFPAKQISALRPFLLALAITDDIGSVIVLGLKFHQSLSPTLIAALIGVIAPAALNSFHKRVLAPLVNYLVVPLFILSSLSAGVKLIGAEASSKISLSLIVARLVGKPLGIYCGARVMSALSKVPLPIAELHLALAGVLASLGLSVSLLFADITLTGVNRSDAIAGTVITIPLALVASALFYFFTRETAA